MRCEAVRMHLAPVLLHGELKLDRAHKWRRHSIRGCGKSHDPDDHALLDGCGVGCLKERGGGDREPRLRWDLGGGGRGRSAR